MLRSMLMLLLGLAGSAFAHDIYTDTTQKTGTTPGTSCCGGSDCNIVRVRIKPNGAEFFVGGPPWVTVPQHWIFIPNERIQFISLPGEDEKFAALPRPPDGEWFGHFCGSVPIPWALEHRASDIFGGMLLYCAFIPSGAS